jgi:hypothetical protein
VGIGEVGAGVDLLHRLQLQADDADSMPCTAPKINPAAHHEAITRTELGDGAVKVVLAASAGHRLGFIHAVVSVSGGCVLAKVSSFENSRLLHGPGVLRRLSRDGIRDSNNDGAALTAPAPLTAVSRFEISRASDLDTHSRRAVLLRRDTAQNVEAGAGRGVNKFRGGAICE